MCKTYKADGPKYLLEWDLRNMCTNEKEATGLYLGEYTDYDEFECDEVTLFEDYECINNVEIKYNINDTAFGGLKYQSTNFNTGTVLFDYFDELNSSA